METVNQQNRGNMAGHIQFPINMYSFCSFYFGGACFCSMNFFLMFWGAGGGGVRGSMHTMQFTQSLTFSLTHSLPVSACPACGGTLGGLRHTSKLASASMFFFMVPLSPACLKSMYLQGLVGCKQRVCLLNRLF